MERQAVLFEEVHIEEGLKIGVYYGARDVERGSGTDYVYLYAYMPAIEYGQLSLPATRSDNHVGLTLPARCIHREAHLYGFTWDNYQAA